MIQQPGQGRRSQKVRGKKKRKKKTFLVKSEDGLCEFRSFIIQAAETIEKNQCRNNRKTIFNCATNICFILLIRRKCISDVDEPVMASNYFYQREIPLFLNLDRVFTYLNLIGGTAFKLSFVNRSRTGKKKGQRAAVQLQQRRYHLHSAGSSSPQVVRTRAPETPQQQD